MTVSVRGAAMLPKLTAHETALTASCSTFGEMPDAVATVSLISDALAAGAETAVFAFLTATAELGLAGLDGDAYRPGVPALSRHTTLAISTLATRLFNLQNLVECLGTEHS